MANISKITYKGTTYDIYDATALHTAPTPYSLPVATYNVLGGVMPFYSNTNAATGVTAASGAKTVAVNALSTTAGKYYAVEVDRIGRLYVNVPWTDTQPTPGADWQNLTGTMESDGYKIDITNGTSTAKVPFFSSSTGGMVKAASGDSGKYLKGDGTWGTPAGTYTLPAARNSTLGGIKTIFENSSQGVVSVPTTQTVTHVVQIVPHPDSGKYASYGLETLASASGNVAYTSIPFMGGATSSDAGSTGLVPAPASGDQNKFLRGDATWQTIDLNTKARHIWFLNSKLTFGTVASGHGSWEATFPYTSTIGVASALASLDNYSGDPSANDTVITSGGFIGYLTTISGTTWSATFIGRLDFMAYSAAVSASSTVGTGYDSATSTLILGEY